MGFNAIITIKMNSNSSKQTFSRYANDRMQQAREVLSLKIKASSVNELQVDSVVQVKTNSYFPYYGIVTAIPNDKETRFSVAQFTHTSSKGKSEKVAPRSLRPLSAALDDLRRQFDDPEVDSEAFMFQIAQL